MNSPKLKNLVLRRKKTSCDETLSDGKHSKWTCQHDSHSTVRADYKATRPTSQHLLYTNTSCNYHRRRGTTIWQEAFFPVVPWGLRQPDPAKSDVLFWLVFRSDNHNLQIKHQTLRGNAPNEYCLKFLWNEHLTNTLLPLAQDACELPLPLRWQWIIEIKGRAKSSVGISDR